MKKQIFNGFFVAIIATVICCSTAKAQTITQINNFSFVTNDLVLLNGKIYFTGRGPSNNLEQVYSVDSQGNNLTNVSNFTHSNDLADIRIVKLLSFNNRLYLQAFSRVKSQQNVSFITQMYTSDGASGFQLWTGMPNTNTASFTDGYYTIYNDKLYYLYDVNIGVFAN